MQAKNVILLIVLFGSSIIFSGPIHRVSASDTTQEVWSGIAAFEEYYDDDYNDWVCGISIQSQTEMIETMVFEFEALARGAGYHHVQHLRISANTFLSGGEYVVYTLDTSGTLIDVSEPVLFTPSDELDIIVFPDSWDAIPPHDPPYMDARMANVWDGSGIQPGQVVQVSFDFDETFYMDLAQYSLPNIGVHGEGLFFEPWMEVPSAGIAVHTGEDWALITDDDWVWPDELSPIWDAYPVLQEGPPVYFPDDWYNSQPTDRIWQPYQEQNVEYDNSLWTWNYNGLSSEWQPETLDTQSRWLFRSETPFELDVVSSTPLDPTEYHDPYDYSDGISHYIWNYEQLVEFVLDSHMQSEPGIEVSRSSNVSILSPGYNSVELTAEVRFNSNPIIEGVEHSIQSFWIGFDTYVWPDIEVSYVSENSYWTPVDLGQTVTFSADAYVINPFEYPVRWMPTVDLNLFIEERLYVEQYSTGVGSVEFQTIGSTGDVLDVTLSGQPDQTIDVAPSALHGDLWLWWIGDYQQIGLDSMTWETTGTLSTFDPHRCYESFGNWISDNVYETLYTHPFDSADNTEFFPLLADSVDISDDGLNYTFSLRQGVRFHDGTFFDAEAVKYNIERLMAIFDTSGPAWMIAEPILGGWGVENAAFGFGAGSQEHIDAYNNWISLEPIIVLDPHTVRIRLHSPFVPFLQCLAYKIGSMVSPAWIENHGGVDIGQNNEYVDTHTCGTGPYKVAGYFEGSHISLVMNDDYWREYEVQMTRPNAASLEVITINILDDSWARHANLVNGESDGAWLDRETWGDLWNPDTSSSLNPNIDVHYGGLTSVIEGLGFNLNSHYTQDGVTYENPFYLRNLRIACSYAFDYISALDAYNDDSGSLSIQAQGCIPIGMFGHDDNLFQYTHDLELAVAAWNDAMAAGLDDILASNSYTLSFYTPTVARWVGLVNSLKDGFSAILSQPDAIQPSGSLTINIVETDWTDYNQRRISQELLVVRVGWAADYSDPDNYAYPFYYSPGTWAQSIGFGDPDVDTWYEQSRYETDLETRRQLFYQMQQRVAEEVAYLMVAQGIDINFQRLDVRGYSFNPMRYGFNWRSCGPYFYHMWKEPFTRPSIGQSTIVWETEGNPSSLDPHICYEVFGNWISDNVYETLFTYPWDSTDTETLVPLLAESVDISEDGQEYTFHLREGVTFHDGTSFNAEAVKYNIERALAIFDPWGPAWMLAEPLLGGQVVESAVFGDDPDDGQGGFNHQTTFNAWKADNDAGTGALWVIDEYTIMMRLAYSYAPFLKALSYEVGSIISPTWIENHGGYQVGQINPYVDTRTCGTGPYQVYEWVRNNHIILTKNQNYWRMDEAQTSNPKAGSIETVVIMINPDAASREDHLLQGETDGCLWPMEDAFAIWDPETHSSTNPRLQVWSEDLTYAIFGAGFNLHQYVEIDETTLENPFYLKDLRIALSYAYDYAMQIEDDLYTLAVQAQGPIPKGMFGHDDNLFMYTHDIDLAVQAWNDAMASGLDAILASHDYTLRFYRSDRWWIKSVMEYVEQGLEAILAHGNAIQPSQALKIEIIPLEDETYRIMRREGNMLVLPVGWTPDYPDPDNYALGFTASYSIWGQWIGYGTETTDEWIRLAAQSMDEAERLALYQQIQQAAVDEVAYIWAVQRNDFHVEKWNVHGYSFNPVTPGPYFYHYWKEPLVVRPPEYLEFVYCNSEGEVFSMLYDGVVDLGSGFITDVDAVDLSSYKLHEEMRSGFGHIVFNTDWYPLDITAFRRAFAFALDKWSFGPSIYGDGFPLDVPLPRTLTQYCVEGTLPFSYYDSNIAVANQLLDQAGFIDVDGDDIREAPDGSPLSIPILLMDHPSHHSALGIVTETMQSLGINCYATFVDYTTFVETFSGHGDFAMTFYGLRLDNDPSWLAIQFHSSNVDTYGMNAPNFENSTFDYYADLMLSAASQQEAYEACAILQYIIAYECPIVPVYEHYMPAAVRYGFENVVIDPVHGATCIDTFNDLLTPSPMYDMVTAAVYAPTEFNPFRATWWYTTPIDVLDRGFNPLTLVYEALARPENTGTMVPWLASSYSVDVVGSTCDIYVELPMDVVWHDLMPLTAYDAAFTYDYMNTHQCPIFYGAVSMVTSVDVLDDTHFVIHLGGSSYWEQIAILQVPILPMHIWTSIVDPYSFENTYPVGSGPFIFYNQISEVVWGLTTADFAGYQMVSLDWPEDAIVWTEEAGDYLIGVDYYTGELPLDYTITISYDGYTKTISEIFSSEDILSIDNVPSSASEIEGIHYVTLPANTEVTINVDWITQGGYADLDIYMWSPSSEYTPDLDSLVLQRWHDYYNTPHEPKLLDSYVSITPSWASTIDFSVYWRVNGPYEVTDATVYWAYSSDNIAWTSWDLLGEFAPLSTYGAGYIDFTSIYGEGHYAFRIEATDVIGHTSSFEFYSGVDLVAPVAEAGQDWIIQQWDYLIFDGSDSTDNIEIASYQWTFTDGEPVTLWGVSPSYQFTSDGTFEVTLTVTDNAGHQSVDYMTVYVVYDTAPPETTVTGPPSGSTVGDDVTYNIESQDETGVATTEVYLDGELVLAEDSAVVDYILDPTTVADGQHTLEIVVTDVFGQEQVTVYVVFTDTTAPEVQSYVPPECSGGCDFTVDARDETGIDRVEFWLDGELRVIDYTDPYVFYIYTPDLTDGEHTLEIIVYDLVGNFVADVQIFVVDNSAPVLTDFTQSWHNGIPGWDLTISATLTDFGTITSCNAIIRSTDGFQVVVPMVNTGLDIFEVTWTVPDTIIGDFFVDIQAVDNLGNIGHYADTGTFTVHDYISVCAIYSEPQLFDYLGQTINRTWNDFFDADGHPLAYFLDDGVSVEILYLSPTQGLYDVEVTYLSGSEYSLEIVATSAGAIIYEELYESLPFGMGAIHEFVVSYSDDPSNSWSDSFDDEDLSDWSITWGDFTAAGGIMTGVTSIWNWANIGSTMTCGTWRFDVHYMGTASFNVWFMTNELVGSEGEPREGYFIHISMYTNSIQLMRDLNRGQIVLDSYTPEGGLDGWWEISVTRYANGEMFVYIDGVLRLHAVDTSFDSSQWFAFETFNTHSIDNIVLTEFAGAGAVADSEALPEGLVVTATDVLYILPGDYLLCQLNWFNIDPGVARDVEIVLEFSEYLEFVSCSYPIVVDGNTITFDIGSVEGFSLEYIEVTFYMVNLLANDGDQLWLNSTMSYSDDWFLFDFESQDNQLVTVVTVTPENSVQTSWWWKNEFTFVLAGQASTYDLNHLQTLVTVIAYSSELYSDITTVEQALSVLTLNDYKGPRGLALRELYGVWLNLANDALNADTVIDLGNLTTAGTVGEAIIECEAVLMVGSSSVRDLLNVMRICQEINAGR